MPAISKYAPRPQPDPTIGTYLRLENWRRNGPDIDRDYANTLCDEYKHAVERARGNSTLVSGFLAANWVWAAQKLLNGGGAPEAKVTTQVAAH